MFNLGPTELIIILIIIIIVFGVGKLPQLGSGLGEGIRNFKKSYKESKAIDLDSDEEDDSTSSS